MGNNKMHDCSTIEPLEQHSFSVSTIGTNGHPCCLHSHLWSLVVSTGQPGSKDKVKVKLG